VDDGQVGDGAGKRDVEQPCSTWKPDEVGGFHDEDGVELEALRLCGA
jgi:hypothetical protein